SWDILDPNYQNKGLGSLLLKFRIEKLKEFKSLKRITVRTSQFAYKFYEKNGFELKEIIKDYWAIGFDLYNMNYLD
ncbi:MAG: GNAT family N-acetyltransferase, partial [Bacteroidota bacterium]|nr:GNAT family N-acetyltransferase [Bacteroidota bacterium]